MEEEIALLEEQLATAHADIERLQGQVAESGASLRTREAESDDLRRQLDEVRTTLGAREQALAATAAEVEEVRGALAAAETGARTAADRYRDLLLASEPHLPGDLVAGDSVEAIDAAAERARVTVAQVRQHLEDQARAIRVPAGAPPRGAPDISGLSPGEKIRLGLESQ